MSSKPKIFVWINQYMSPDGDGDVISAAIAEDGTALASHFSSNEEWARHDMGLTSGWKHEYYKAHYPEGYELEWVDDVDNHVGFNEAIELNQKQIPEE